MDKVLTLSDVALPQDAGAMGGLSTELEAECREARSAQRWWSEFSVQQRLEVVRRFRYEVAEHARALAIAAAGEGADPIAVQEAMVSQVLPLADACRFLEREARGILQDQTIGRSGRPLWLSGAVTVVRREPIGVVLILAASNYPLFLPGVQALQALVAGNAVLWKPGKGGGLAGLLMRRLLVKAGLNEWLIRMLPEHEQAGREATRLPVDKIFLTGSFATGRDVLRSAADQVVPVIPELSGCDAVIVRADADLDLVARALRFGLCLNGSATCIAPRKVFVPSAQATPLIARLRQRLDPLLQWDLPLPDAARLSALIEEALGRGAELLHGDLKESGELLGPIVLGSVDPRSAILQESFFAPILCVVETEGDAEACAEVNGSRFALGVSIFSSSLEEAEAIGRRLQVGGVVINDMIVTTADPRLPFGGRRQSGFGVTRGREGLLEMTATKVMTVRKGKNRPHFDPADASDGPLFEAYVRLVHGKGLRARFRAAIALMHAIQSKIRKPNSRETVGL